MNEKEILKKISKLEKEKEQELNAIKFFRKEIWQNNDRLGVLKSDCERIIKSVNRIKDLENGLIKLYRKQNKIGERTHKEIEKLIGIKL